MAAIAAVAAVVTVLASRPGDDPDVATTADTAVSAPDGLVGRRLDPPIECEQDVCPSLAVSPEGTLVAYDQAAKTLTWYDAEPHVLPVTADLDAEQVRLEAIGPANVAYLLVGSPGTESWQLVAIDPSGEEITRGLRRASSLWWTPRR